MMANIQHLLDSQPGPKLILEKIGKIGGDKIKLNGIEIDLDEAKNIYFNRFKQVMKNDIEGLI